MAYEIMHHAHFTMNPGHKSRVLYTTLVGLYYWDSMREECEAFVRACRICGARLGARARQVMPGAAPTPGLPFEVIHIDFKGPLKRSGEYDHILVVVCALTRYTLYIPTVGRSAETVFRALVARVFGIFGPPKGARWGPF